MYRKVHTVNMIKKYFFDEKEFSISAMVEEALNEYFDKRKDEIQKIMDEYHEKGGCGDL